MGKRRQIEQALALVREAQRALTAREGEGADAARVGRARAWLGEQLDQLGGDSPDARSVLEVLDKAARDTRALNLAERTASVFHRALEQGAAASMIESLVWVCFESDSKCSSFYRWRWLRFGDAVIERLNDGR